MAYSKGMSMTNPVRMRSTQIITGSDTLSPSQSAHVASLLRSAATLYPGTEVDVLRARVAMNENQEERAREILHAVVRSEPENLIAWDLLAVASGGHPQQEALALRHVAQLHPGLHLHH